MIEEFWARRGRTSGGGLAPFLIDGDRMERLRPRLGIVPPRVRPHSLVWLPIGTSSLACQVATQARRGAVPWCRRDSSWQA